MTKLLSFLFLLPIIVSAQEVITSAGAPLKLYQEIHNDLATDRVGRALKNFHEVVSYYKDKKQFSELPQSYFGMALGLALNGHYRESIRYHRKAIRIHKKYRKDEPLEIYMNLGFTYSLAGKERRAKRILGNSFSS